MWILSKVLTNCLNGTHEEDEMNKQATCLICDHLNNGECLSDQCEYRTHGKSARVEGGEDEQANNR